MINYIISECSKSAHKEYKTRYDWVGNVINRELCKKSIFDHTKKWYMYNSEHVQENEKQKNFCFFVCVIQTDPLISARRPDLVIINRKENLPHSQLCCFSRPESESQRKWKERPYTKTKLAMEYVGDGDTILNWCTQNDRQILVRRLEEFEIGGRAEKIQTKAKNLSLKMRRKNLSGIFRYDLLGAVGKYVII